MRTSTVRWRTGWTAIVAALIVLDLHREKVDTKAGRDHVNGTTFSCLCRWLITLTPGGLRLFDLGLGCFVTWFRPHITDPLVGPSAINRNAHR